MLCLNVEDLYLQDKRGEIKSKGGATELIHWQSGTAQLLPRLIAGRTRGPLFLTGRRAPAGTPTLNVCEETGRARISYRRAEEIFEQPTRLPANPPARPENTEDLEGWTLHRLRHSALTRDAEGGSSTPMLPARSRHASVRSLERYARPGVDAGCPARSFTRPGSPPKRLSRSTHGALPGRHRPLNGIVPGQRYPLISRPLLRRPPGARRRPPS